MTIPRWLQPWHFLVISGGFLAYAAAIAVKRAVSPATSPALPPTPEGYAPMQPEKTCDPTPKPGVVAFRNYIMSRFGGTDMGIIRECTPGSTSGHTAGTAWDWGVLANNPRIDEMFTWLFANDGEMIKRTGLMYFIYNRRIWNTRDRVWLRYDGQSPHTDHVHFSFGTEGAMGRTSFFRERVS